MTQLRPRHLMLLLLILCCAASGCMSPRLMPAAPIATNSDAAGNRTSFYDTNRDGRRDYAEQWGSDGRVAVLRFDSNRDGELDLQVALDQLDRSQSRQLLIILDSVPYNLVRALRDAGRLRLFHEPSAIVSPFPVIQQ